MTPPSTIGEANAAWRRQAEDIVRQRRAAEAASSLSEPELRQQLLEREIRTVELELEVADLRAALGRGNDRPSPDPDTADAEQQLNLVRQTQDEWRLAKEEWERTFDAVPDLIAILDPDRRITRMNRAMAERLKVDPADCLGRPCFLFFHDPAEPPAQCPHAMMLEDGREHVVENWEPLLKGHFLVSASPIRDHDGQLVGSVHVARDITEMKKAQQALELANEHLRAIFENAPIYMSIVDWDGRLIRASRTVGELFGRPVAELLGQPVTEFLAPGFRETTMEKIREMQRDPRSRVVSEMYPQGDIPMLLEGVHFPLLDAHGTPYALGRITQDVTERKQAEIALKKNEVRLATLLEVAQHPTTDIQGFLDFALDKALLLTQSPVGYIYHYDEATRRFNLHAWSKDVSPQCRVLAPQTIYSLDQTGIWGEAVRQRRPILVNDFAAPNLLKKGCPPGHIGLTRFLTLPIFDLDRIIAVVGVGNKDQPYEETDIQDLRLLMDGIWRTIRRHQIEEELRAGEEKYRTVADWTFDWELWLDPQNRVQYCSPSVERVTGWRVEEFMADPELLAQIVHPEDRDLWARHYREMHDMDHPQAEFVFRIVTRSGEPRWIQHLCRAVFGLNDRFLGRRISNRDVTEARLADLHIRESREKYRLLFERMLNGFALHEIICNDQGTPVDYRFLEVNPAFEEMTGLKAGNILNRTVLEVLPKTEPFWIDTYGRVALKGEHYTFEHFSSELQRYYGVTAFRSSPGQFAVLISDITTRKMVENALEESEEKFRALVENLSDIVIRFNRDLRILYVSPSIQTLTGSTPDEFAERPLGTGPITPALLTFWQTTLQSVFNTGTTRESRFELAGPNGSQVFDWRLFPEFDEAGQVSTVLSIARDITPQVAAERERQETAEHLAQSNERLHALASKLESVREEEKTRVSRQIHDELGQLLTGMKMEVSRLAQWLARPEGPPPQERIEGKVGEIGVIAHDALESVRSIARELRPRVIDDLGLAAAVEWQVANFQERSGIPCDLSVRIRDGLVAPRTSVAIFRILQEGLTNILRHAQARKITVRLFSRRHWVVLELQDDGVGIGAVKLDSSRSLGIIGMQERARQCGGMLTITGHSEDGTLLHLEVPFSPEGKTE